MNRINIFLIALVAALCVASCSTDTKSEPDYPVYEVKVRSNLAVRSGASVRADKIASLPPGARVRVVEAEAGDGWARVIYDDEGNMGYVSSRFIVALNPPETETPQKDSNALKVPDGWTFRYVIVPSVEYSEIYDLTDNVFDSIAAETGSDEHLAVFTYVADCRLVNYQTDGSTRNYISNTHPDGLFDIQRRVALDSIGADGALAMLSEFVASAISERSEVGFYKRWRMSSESFVDGIFDLVFIRNVLPGNDFLHRYLFNWLLKYPKRAMNLAVERGGSVWSGLLLVAALMLALHLLTIFASYAVAVRGHRGGCLIGLLQIFNPLGQIFGLLVMIVFMVYFFPSMENIAVMQLSGCYSEAEIARTLDFYTAPGVGSGWLAYTLFVGSVAAVGLLHVDLLSRAAMTREDQCKALRAQFAKINDKKIVGAIKASRISSKSLDELLATPKPYMAIYDEKTPESAGIKISAALLACMAISATTALFGAIFFGTNALRRLISLGANRMLYNKRRILL